MRIRKSNLFKAMSLIGSGALLLQTTASPGCVGYAARSTLAVADFCFIFDCQNGAFGGTFKPCSAVTTTTDANGQVTSLPLFADCPTVTTP
ncbi:MAG: hypothetical protein HY287_02095 [Planctomycetes bacterium]|nr:hypothetical protein [Planctomycetota bacterium]MBI3833102.1 hypothetical protein [Planctomycetota bacterium]